MKAKAEAVARMGRPKDKTLMEIPSVLVLVDGSVIPEFQKVKIILVPRWEHSSAFCKHGEI
jgi:hypothetical protein